MSDPAKSHTSTASRPILHHLNADTSWLIQLPIPESHRAGSGSGTGQSSSSRKYFNILLDPWLSGSQSDVAAWFSRQWHSEAPAYGSIAAVQALCQASEDPVIDGVDTRAREENNGAADPNQKWEEKCYIDAVAISHEFTDHCHKQTLLELPKSTPVFAWSKAAKLIRGWGWFDNVVEVKRFGGDWRDTRCSECQASEINRKLFVREERRRDGDDLSNATS